MKFKFASLIVMALIVRGVAAQNDYTIPNELQVISSENAAQLTPLGQLGSIMPRDVRWSPNGQTLLATTDEGLYRYRLDALDEGIYVPGMQDLQYSAAENFAFSGRHRLDAASLEIIDDSNQHLIADGTVMSIYETINDSPVIHLVDAETLDEFATLPTSGDVVLSKDRRHAAVWRGKLYGEPGYTSYVSSPYHVELWDTEFEQPADADRL